MLQMVVLSGAAKAIQDELTRMLIANSRRLSGFHLVVHARSEGLLECTFSASGDVVLDEGKKAIIRDLITSKAVVEWLRTFLSRRLGWQVLRLQACPRQRSSKTYVWSFVERR